MDATAQGREELEVLLVVHQTLGVDDRALTDDGTACEGGLAEEGAVDVVGFAFDAEDGGLEGFAEVQLVKG